VVAGGPKMGKTTLLQQVAGGLLDVIRPVGADLLRYPIPDLKKFLSPGRKPVILFLDGCEALLPEPSSFLRQAHRLTKSMNRSVRALVWAGGVAWGEWAMAHRPEFGHSIRYYPLGVLPPKEARPLLIQCLPERTPSSEMERLLDLSGGHPYLLRALLEGQEIHSDGFFAELWKAASSPSEQAILSQLVSAGSWVHLEDLRDGMGGKPPKAILDRLAILGLIIRTLVDGAAAVRIVSPLLLDWARAYNNQDHQSFVRR